MMVFLIFLATLAVTLLSVVFLGRYFERAAIRAAEQAAKDCEPPIGSVCGEERRASPPQDVERRKDTSKFEPQLHQDPSYVIDTRTGELVRVERGVLPPQRS